MTVEPRPRPAFLGDAWFQPEQGYSYVSSPDLDLGDERLLYSADPWMRFLFIFERAKAGDFRYIGALPDLVGAGEDPFLATATLDLMGAAGPTPLLEQLLLFMADPVFDVRLDTYAACTMSYRLILVEPLLRARREHLSTERGMIESSLSKLLEPRVSTIGEPMAISHAAYEALVRQRATEVEAALGRGAAVFRGDLLSVTRIIGDIERLARDETVQDNAGTLMDYLHRFEALTGVPCPGLFDEDGNPLPLSMRVMVDDVRRSGRLGAFVPGHRYFFGHALAD